MARPQKYGEPTRRRHLHLPVSTGRDLEKPAAANGESVSHLLVLGAVAVASDPERFGLQAAPDDEA